LDLWSGSANKNPYKSVNYNTWLIVYYNELFLKLHNVFGQKYWIII